MSVISFDDDTFLHALSYACAKKENIPEQNWFQKFTQSITNDLTAFHIEYDNYYSTNSPENRFSPRKFIIA